MGSESRSIPYGLRPVRTIRSCIGSVCRLSIGFSSPLILPSHNGQVSAEKSRSGFVSGGVQRILGIRSRGNFQSGQLDSSGPIIPKLDHVSHGIRQDTSTQHRYDLAGRQTSVTQAYGTSNATTTSYTYDAAGRKLSETDLLSHTTTYTYDAAGNLTGVSGVKGNRSYAY